MLNIPIIAIQSAAPGPPIVIATATPAILPSPTVPESDAARAWKELIAPSALGSG